jgi:hypothetical protein
MNGFVAIHRRLAEHPLFASDAGRFGAWVWLIANAAWKPTAVRIKGTLTHLERGELTFSQRFLAEKWGWSKSRVDRFIADLRAEGMIATRSKIGASAGHNAGQGQSIITICNYDKYQDKEQRPRGNDEPLNGATAGQQRGKEEQGNKDIPLSNDNGASDFWTFAVAYLGEKKRPLIGKWCGQYGQPDTAQAITAAQLARAVEPVAYIEKVLRGQSTGPFEYAGGPC